MELTWEKEGKQTKKRTRRRRKKGGEYLIGINSSLAIARCSTGCCSIRHCCCCSMHDYSLLLRTSTPLLLLLLFGRVFPLIWGYKGNFHEEPFLFEGIWSIKEQRIILCQIWSISSISAGTSRNALELGREFLTREFHSGFFQIRQKQSGIDNTSPL